MEQGGMKMLESDLIKEIFRSDTKTLQDIIHAVIQTWDDRNPDHELIIVSIPKSDRKERERIIREAIEMDRSYNASKE